MSIELKDARHELDVLEKFINNPELIMSDLSVIIKHFMLP